MSFLGLFLEGARWNSDVHHIDDPRPKELFSPMPVIHKIPEQHRETPQSGIYRCPVYKILSRRGVLSTTGHSTNFVLWLEVCVLYFHMIFGHLPFVSTFQSHMYLLSLYAM